MTRFNRPATLQSVFVTQSKERERTASTVKRFGPQVFPSLSRTGMNAINTNYTLVKSGFVMPHDGLVEVFAAVKVTDGRSASAGRESELFCRIDQTDGTNAGNGRILGPWAAPVTAKEYWTTAGTNQGTDAGPGSFIVRAWNLPAGSYTIAFNLRFSGTGTVNASATGLCAFRII